MERLLVQRFLKKAKSLKIEAEFYQNGSKVIEFDVSGFDASKLVE